MKQTLEDRPHLCGGAEQPRHLDHHRDEGARVGLRQPDLLLLALPVEHSGELCFQTISPFLLSNRRD